MMHPARFSTGMLVSVHPDTAIIGSPMMSPMSNPS